MAYASLFSLTSKRESPSEILSAPASRHASACFACFVQETYVWLDSACRLSPCRLKRRIFSLQPTEEYIHSHGLHILIHKTHAERIMQRGGSSSCTGLKVRRHHSCWVLTSSLFCRSCSQWPWYHHYFRTVLVQAKSLNVFFPTAMHVVFHGLWRICNHFSSNRSNNTTLVAVTQIRIPFARCPARRQVDVRARVPRYCCWGPMTLPADE
jgi:hypothetical protein